MTNPADLAGPHGRLVDELLVQGFVLLGEEVDQERFGNGFLLLRRNATLLRVVKDRSQWFVEIAGPDGEEWFSPAVWRALLKGELGSLEPMTPEEVGTFVRENLVVIEDRATGSSGGAPDELHEWRAKRASARRASPA